MWRMTMDPISMAAGAIPMVSGLLDKGLDVAKGALDLANKLVDTVGKDAKVAGDAHQSEGKCNY